MKKTHQRGEVALNPYLTASQLFLGDDKATILRADYAPAPSQAHSQIRDGKARVCTSSPHSYLNIGDSGCFIHLRSGKRVGQFVTPGDQQQYSNKFCPFASDSEQDQSKREVLVRFWVRSVLLGRSVRSMNDIGQFCVKSKGEPTKESLAKLISRLTGKLQVKEKKAFEKMHKAHGKANVRFDSVNLMTQYRYKKIFHPFLCGQSQRDKHSQIHAQQEN
jgi:hypothetical protein